jgi:phospholipid/cholesterol/gamma-HCH transport system permease protein
MAFLGQLKRAVQIEYVFQSLIKSLTFSWVIALVSIRRGLQVRGGADAVGKATTQSVVTCISLIILADAAFSFVFYV